jgi:hypothetical protein
MASTEALAVTRSQDSQLSGVLIWTEAAPDSRVHSCYTHERSEIAVDFSRFGTIFISSPTLGLALRCVVNEGPQTIWRPLERSYRSANHYFGLPTPIGLLNGIVKWYFVYH